MRRVESSHACTLSWLVYVTCIWRRIEQRSIVVQDFIGIIDEVRIWDYVRSQAEIREV